jgi:hypothetical protein
MRTDLLDTLRIANILGGSVTIAFVLVECVIILPFARRVAPTDGVDVMRFGGSRAWRWGPAGGTIFALTAIAVVALWSDARTSAAAVLTILGLALWLLAVVVTYAWYFPIDQRVRRLGAREAQTDAPKQLRLLARAHVARMSCYVLGFACAVVGAILS